MAVRGELADLKAASALAEPDPELDEVHALMSRAVDNLVLRTSIAAGREMAAAAVDAARGGAGDGAAAQGRGGAASGAASAVSGAVSGAAASGRSGAASGRGGTASGRGRMRGCGGGGTPTNT
jgi:hypothetical protein